MKYAVSVAMVVMLLGMPLGCILNFVPSVHPCCPRTGSTLKCPYDTFDSAKIAKVVATVAIPSADRTGIAPQVRSIPPTPVPSIAEDRSDLHLLNRILRI
jgi:hypothetical protein